MANLTSLYSKLKFLKKIENNTKPGAAQKIKADLKTVTYTKENVNFKPNVAKSIVHNLKTRDIKVKVVKKSGEEVKGKMVIVTENKVNFITTEQVDGAKVLIEGKIKQNRNPFIVTGEYIIRAMMGVRSLSLTYTSSQGEYLPGYTPHTKYLGMSSFNNRLAPGWPLFWD